MRKTQRRKLYGRSRRRQRGKGVGTLCKWALLGALASFSGAHAEDIGFRGRVSNWFNNPNPMDPAPSVDLADYITEMKWAPSWNLYPDTCETARGVDEAKVVEPYLLPDVDLKQLKYGPTYEWNGQQFTYETWSNNQDRTALITPSEGAAFNVPLDAKFKVISVPPDDDLFGGRRSRSRKQRRKTLRRK